MNAHTLSDADSRQDKHVSAYIEAVAAVVVVLIDVCLAASAGAGDGAVIGPACLVAVGAEAGVVGLAVPAQVARLCIVAHTASEHTASFWGTIRADALSAWLAISASLALA